MATVFSKGYVAFDDALKVDRNGAKIGQTAKLGGRVDIKKQIEDIDFTLSLTDASVRDFESGPWVKDLILTADKKINSNVNFGVGYDLGLKNVFASVSGEGIVSGKDVAGKATYFQRGNVLRAEGSIKFDAKNSLWAAYTYGDTSNTMNSTFVNLTERNGFIISPFTVPVATAAAKYTFEHDGYVVEPSIDINRQAPYLSVSKAYNNNLVRAQYSFKDEVAMVEVGHRRFAHESPLVKAYFKAPLGADKVGPLSIGFIVDKVFDV